SGGPPDVGTPIVVIGNPEGFRGTVAEGIISGLRKSESGTWLQMSAPISRGSSGGPVLTQSGEVVGVSTMMWKEGQSLNFARPVEAVESLLAYNSGAPGSFEMVSKERERVLLGDPGYVEGLAAFNAQD